MTQYPECQHCDSRLKPCFNMLYCPNDKCYSNRGRPEFEKAHEEIFVPCPVCCVVTPLSKKKCDYCRRAFQKCNVPRKNEFCYFDRHPAARTSTCVYCGRQEPT